MPHANVGGARLFATIRGYKMPPPRRPPRGRPKPNRQRRPGRYSPQSIQTIQKRRWRVATGGSRWPIRQMPQFVGICGNRPLSDYSRADAMTFRKTAERMPFDCGKAAAYRDLSPAEIIARYEALRKRFPVATKLPTSSPASSSLGPISAPAREMRLIADHNMNIWSRGATTKSVWFVGCTPPRSHREPD